MGSAPYRMSRMGGRKKMLEELREFDRKKLL
jgi:hypothetical protein